MPSLKSRLLIFAMKNSHWLRFRLKRDAWDENASIPEFRRQCEAGNCRMKLREGIAVRRTIFPR